MENNSPPATKVSAVKRAEAVVAQFEQKLAVAREETAKRQQISEKSPQEHLTPTERADTALTNAGERIGKWFSSAAHQVRRTAAFAREEAEDIWAEAQSVSRRSGIAPPQDAQQSDAGENAPAA